MKRPRGKIAGAFLVFLLTTGAATRAQAQTFTILYSFAGGSDGRQPEGGLLLDAAGNLYGTTAFGGTSNAGTVFKVDASAKETVLHRFASSTAVDGATPVAGLIMDAARNLYGTTEAAGSFGFGIVFKLDTSGNETVLYSFTGGGDGSEPQAGVIMDASGNLYGTTLIGGSGNCSSNGVVVGCGTVFKLTSSGNETVLHSFTGGSDGAEPFAGLVMDAAGNLYGTTSGGGSSNCTSGCGIVFRLDPSGKETVLHSFTGASDGAEPEAGLIMDAAGNLYGTTDIEGSGNCSINGMAGCGTVFKLNTLGNKTVLHSFTDSDGSLPNGPLIMDKAGNLYGTTFGGGAFGLGTAFKLDTSGHETVLHSFTNAGGSGYAPSSGLVMDAAGSLYGTTQAGGAFGFGTVFKLASGATARKRLVQVTSE